MKSFQGSFISRSNGSVQASYPAERRLERLQQVRLLAGAHQPLAPLYGARDIKHPGAVSLEAALLLDGLALREAVAAGSAAVPLRLARRYMAYQSGAAVVRLRARLPQLPGARRVAIEGIRPIDDRVIHGAHRRAAEQAVSGEARPAASPQGAIGENTGEPPHPTNASLGLTASVSTRTTLRMLMSHPTYRHGFI